MIEEDDIRMDWLLPTLCDVGDGAWAKIQSKLIIFAGNFTSFYLSFITLIFDIRNCQTSTTIIIMT